MQIRKTALVIILLLFSAVAVLQADNALSTAWVNHHKLNTLLRPFAFTSPGTVDTMIVNLLQSVNADSISASIVYLQHYETRYYSSPQAFKVQDWLFVKLKSYGYTVNLQHITNLSGSSANIIATLSGTTYPEENIVMGAHYDSYTDKNLAPGADDNASGTAAILEIARVLSKHSFQRSIIFCFWTAEEVGCKGSAYFVSQARAVHLNILGYLNLDMCGFLNDSIIHSNVIAPQSAQPLVDYYIKVCFIYLPDFRLTKGGSIPGSSDFSSFNSAGYMGIFPFEEVDHYSPFMHTSEDLLGKSVNSLKMVMVFTQSVMATAMEMAMGEEKRKEEQEVKKPDICADRPGMATPPALVLPQYFQLESGFSFEKLMTDISLQESSQYPNILIRYGISKIAELRLQTDFTNVRTDNQNITGFDPLGIGTKIFICKGSGYLPATSILFNLTLPKTGDKRLMSNHAAPSVYLLMQHDLSDRFNICYNLGLEYDGEKAVPTDFTALCFGYNLNEKFSVFAENYNWFANNSAPDYYVDLGGAYLITNNLQADFSANFHLINVRNYFMLNTGISWRM